MFKFSNRQEKWNSVNRTMMIVGVIAVSCLCTRTSSSEDLGQMNKPASGFIAKDLNGNAFDLSKLKGKVTLIIFWATWCAPCRKEMPRLDAFYRRYHNSGLEMIGVSIDRPEDAEKVKKKMLPFAYPAVLLKNVELNGFGAPKGVPITFVVDANGIVRDQFIEVRDELLNTVVKPLLTH